MKALFASLLGMVAVLGLVKVFQRRAVSGSTNHKRKS